MRFLHFFIPMVYSNITHNSRLFTIKSYNRKKQFENNCKPKFDLILFINETSNLLVFYKIYSCHTVIVLKKTSLCPKRSPAVPIIYLLSLLNPH